MATLPNDNSSQQPRYISTEQAAQFLNYSPRYMENLRRTGDGPPFVAAGKRKTYDIADLIAWANARKRLSTSEAA